MTQHNEKTITVNRYLFAVFVITIATVLRIWPLQLLGSSLTWLTFYPAVMIAAAYGGFAVGLLTMGMACLVVTFCWHLLVAAPFINNSIDLIGMSVFALTGIMMSVVSELMIRATLRAIKAEAKMREAKEVAENAARSKSEFLSSMSHEIRTPMNAVIGLTRLALETELNARQSDYLRKIMSSSKALLNILNDVLDFSKIEAGRLTVENAEFTLEDTLENTLNLFIASAEEKGLELFCEVERDVPTVITGDALRVGQVLNNIVGNAVKFTEKGEIYIRVEVVERSAESCVLRFTVRDTGVGLSGEQAQKLFTPFQQADGSISRKYGGTGLGLAISLKLVKLMGGDISVSGELGKGSTFIFTSRFGLTKASSLKRNLVNLQPMKTLVVDDSQTSLDIMKGLLESWRFDVTACLCGVEALRQIALADKAEKPFQILLLDWKMPEMTGLDVAKSIREKAAQGQLASPPIVIMVTAYSKEQLLAEAEATRLDAVLIKPVSASALYNTILDMQQPGAREISGSLQPETNRIQCANAIRGARLLLVEDNEINQQVAFEMLSKAGFRVVVVSSGQDALKMVENEAFDGILMDLQMPGLDGYQTASLILEKPDCKDIPIIAMSAAVMQEDKMKCSSVGMVDHVSKPMIPEALIGTLLKWVKPANHGFEKITGNASPGSEAYNVPLNQPGFNISEAIKRVGGNKKLLCKLLCQFSDDYTSVVGRLDTLARAGDKKGTLALLHTLKGVAGSVGAARIHDISVKLENDLKEGQFPVSFDGLNGALQEALEFISREIKKEEVTSRFVEYNHEEAANRLNELVSYLKKQKIYPVESLAYLMSLLQPNVNAELLSRLGRQVDNFNYKDALSTVGEIASKLNIPVGL